MNLNLNSYHCWYFPQNYPKLTNKLKKQKPAFSGVPAFSRPTTCMCNSFLLFTVTYFFACAHGGRTPVHIECVQLLHGCRAWKHLH